MSTIITKVKEQDCVFKSRQLTTKISHENQGFEQWLLMMQDHTYTPRNWPTVFTFTSFSMAFYRYGVSSATVFGFQGQQILRTSQNWLIQTRCLKTGPLTRSLYFLFSISYTHWSLTYNKHTSHTYIFIQTHIHKYTQTYKQTYIHTCIQTNIGTHIHLLHINSYKHSSFSLCSADTCQFY